MSSPLLSPSHHLQSFASGLKLTFTNDFKFRLPLPLGLLTRNRTRSSRTVLVLVVYWLLFLVSFPNLYIESRAVD